MIFLGVIGTLIYMRISPDSFQFNSICTLGIMAIYAGYFALLGKITKVLSNR